MKLLEKILLPTDFSQGAEEALSTAIALARTSSSQVIPIHIVPESWAAAVGEAEAQAEASNRLQELQARIQDAGIAAPQLIVDVGSPFEAIVQHAERRDVSLIVIGSKGIADEEYPLGLTAGKVIQKVSKPVWVAKEGSETRTGKILCAVDFSAPSHRALHHAAELARHLGSELKVLTVIQPLSVSDLGVAASAAETAEFSEGLEESQFDHFLQEFDLSGVDWEKVVRHGRPHREIITCARETAADLLVMGSVGRTGLARLLVGSVAEKVTREMPCSVVVVKAEHAARVQVEAEIADVEARFRQGQELLDGGFPTEAMGRFESCIGKDMMFAPAWEGLATAHARLGHAEKAEECRQQAKYVHQKNWERKVEAEMRGELWDGPTSKV